MIQQLKRSVIRDFNKAAYRYDEYAVMQRIVSDELFSMVRGLITKESLVLDAGCGTGYFHELLRKNKLYCPLIQLDISFNMCGIARDYGSSGEYGSTYSINSDIDHMPFADNAVDIVFSSLALQWSSDLRQSLSELRRVTKEGGSIAISTIGDGSLCELLQSFSKIDDEQHIHSFISKEELHRSVKAAGFSDVEIKEKAITLYYDDVKAVLNSIKGVGASYKERVGGKYVGRKYFSTLDEIYKSEFGADGKVPVSWNILYAVAIGL